jgi:hypothetical protein
LAFVREMERSRAPCVAFDIFRKLAVEVAEVAIRRRGCKPTSDY